MASYRHNLRNIQRRTVNGRRVWRARLFDEGGFVRWWIQTIDGAVFVDGGNFRAVAEARQSLREALDPMR